VRGLRVPFVLVVQHHAIPSATRLAAPVSLPMPGDVDVLTPKLMVNGTLYRARILDISAVPLVLLGETVASTTADRDAIMGAIDLVVYGYPVGLPPQRA
jgi:hypothetical protein